MCASCRQGWMAQPMKSACPFCHKLGSDRTCVQCKFQTFLDGLSAYLPYGNPVVRGAISFWKYDGDKSVEPILKQWLLQSIDRIRPPFEDFVVAHVPVHHLRCRARGFDQAQVIAEWVGEMYQAPCINVLIRQYKTLSQAKTFHTERRVGELDGIFSLHPLIKEIPNRILLCDDVFTSGATMDAAAKCLKEAGVKEVWGFVIARG